MRIKGILVAASAMLAPVGVQASPLVFEINGPDPESIEGTVDAFREALGPNNGNAPAAGDPFGRRQINWDAAPDGISDPGFFPGDFFNFNAEPRARGIEFVATGDTEGFQLSSTEASGEPVLFGEEKNFQTFSPERVFTPVGGTTFDVQFFTPEDNEQQGFVRGLGVVFTDVEVEGSTKMSFFASTENFCSKRKSLPGPIAASRFSASSSIALRLRRSASRQATPCSMANASEVATVS